MTLMNVSAGSKYLAADEANGKVFFNATFLIRDCTLDAPVWHLALAQLVYFGSHLLLLFEQMKQLMQL